MAELNSGEQDAARQGMKIYELALKVQDWVTTIETCRVPVICSMHGYSIGIAIDLSSACDIRVCSKDAKFTIKEIDIGICADLGVMQRFQKVVANDSWTRELKYTGRFFDAQEALTKGYVSHVLESGEASLAMAMKIATNISKKSPPGVWHIKKSILYSRDHTIDEGLNNIKLW